MTPLRVDSEEALYGHLVFAMIAATINVYIQNKTKCIYDDREEIFIMLRNQKCMVRKTKITNTKPQARANALYKAFHIECPLYLENGGDLWILRYHLPKVERKEL